MSEIDEEQPYICHECVSDEFLNKEIRCEGKCEKCSYCGKNRKAIQLSTLAESIHCAIEQHFHLTSSEPSAFENAMLSDRESSYWWARSGQPIHDLIQDVAGIGEGAAADIQEYLSTSYGYYDPSDYESEDPYGADACYEESPPDSHEFHESWELLRQEITYRARFFSKFAEQVLDKLFGNLDALEVFDGKSVVRIAGPDTENPDIFRARVAQTRDSLEQVLKDPVKELAAPPPKSAKHGRMNPACISVFYGATDAETCISEVRPPIGSHVVVGRFQIIRNIRLLDLNILSEIYVKGSCFDPDFKTRKEHAAFFQHFVGELTKPVMPDEETFEYLPTQIVAEYLAEKVEPRLDGIMFESSQAQGKGQNIILFHDSCFLEPYDLPSGATVSINYGWSSPDDYDDSITVCEDLPTTPQQKQFKVVEIDDQGNPLVNNPITLSLDINNDIDVMAIKGATYQSHIRSVSRYRRNKSAGESLSPSIVKLDSLF